MKDVMKLKQGTTLEELGRRVAREAELKDDLVVDTRELILLNGEELSVPTGINGLGQERGEYHITDLAHRQIGERLGIPAKFYDRLRFATQGEGDQAGPHEVLRQLLDTNVNTLFREAPERRLVRTFKPQGVTWSEEGQEQGVARAFLSDRYHRRDNDELLAHIVPILAGIPDAKVESSALTDTRLYLKVVTPRISGEVQRGDEVQAGVLIRNSEVGHGALAIEPFVYRLICTNGMVVADATAKHFVGRHIGGHAETDETLRLYRSETIRKDDEAFYAKVGDVVKAAVDETAFNAILQALRESREGTRIQKPVESIERLQQRFVLSDDEREHVLAHLVEGGDLSQYGALNAVTRASQNIASYDRATELETIGGQVLALPRREWEVIAA